MAQNDHIVMPEDHMEQLYSSANPFVRFVHNQRLKTMVDALPAKEGLRVLDAGCGEGQLLARMHRRAPDNSYTGVDITDVALQRAKGRAHFATLRKADLGSLPFGDGTFDVITCTEVIEHIHEFRKVLMEFRRVLKGGGTLIISFPNETLWTMARVLLLRRPFKVADHVNSFSPGKMRQAMPLTFIKKSDLPCGFPFFVSLNCVMLFRKD